jgi:hypothetical protein
MTSSLLWDAWHGRYLETLHRIKQVKKILEAGRQ